jgi:transcriptional regulator with XRE-family HTH domain
MGTTDSSPNTSRASGQLFGDTLRQLRRSAGLTQTELAEVDLLKGNATAALTRLEPWLDRASSFERMATTLLPLLAWVCSDLGDGTRSAALLAECQEQTRARHYLLVEALRIQAVLSLRQARYPEVETALEEALHLAKGVVRGNR